MQAHKSRRQRKFDKLFEENYEESMQLFSSDVWEGKKPARLREEIILLPQQLTMKKKDSGSTLPTVIDLKEEEEKLKIINQVMLKNVPDTRRKIQDTRNYPYCCIGVVTGNFEEQPYHGTGFLVAPKIVCTTAHNLYDRELKEESQDLKFTPAMNGRIGNPLKIKKVYFSEEYKKGKEDQVHKYDVGLMEVEEDLSEQFGHFGIDFRESNRKFVEEVQICGYPQQSKMWSAVGPFKKTTENFIFYKISTQTGQAGSPIFKIKNGKQYIIGVHIGGDHKKNVGLKMTERIRKIFNNLAGEKVGKLNLVQSEVAEREMKYLAEKASGLNMVTVNLRSNKINSFGLSFLSKTRFPNTKELYLDNNEIGDQGMGSILKIFPFVKELTVSNNKITGTGIWKLCLDSQENSEVQVLDVSKNILGDETMKFFHKFVRLTNLNLMDTSITAEGLFILSEKRFPNLRSLTLNDNEITDIGMKSLHQFQVLEELYLEKTGITGKGLQILCEGTFPYLHILQISENYIQDEGMVYLQKLQNLSRIYMKNTQITGKSLQLLSQGNFPRLEVLYLDQNKIEDLGIKFLHKSSSLGTLSLSNIGLTRKGVEMLWQISLPKLNVLKIWGNKIEQEGKEIAEKMKKQRNIHVYYDFDL